MAGGTKRDRSDKRERALVGAEIGVESNLTVIRGTELVELPVVPQELTQ